MKAASTRSSVEVAGRKDVKVRTRPGYYLGAN